VRPGAPNGGNVTTFNVETGLTVGRYLSARAGWLRIGLARLNAFGDATDIDRFRQSHFFGATNGATVIGSVRYPVRWRLGDLAPFAEYGVWRWTAASGSSTLLFPKGAPPPEDAAVHPSTSGWDQIYGAGVEWMLRPEFGVTVGARTTTLAHANHPDGANLDQRFTVVLFGLTIRGTRAAR
jgi:hypothetical protein